MRTSTLRPPWGLPLSRPSAAPGPAVKPPQPPTLRSARAAICATPSQVGTGRRGVLASLLPALRGQSISQSPISCSASPFPVLPHSCSCIPHRDSPSPLVLHLHAPASPLPCSCIPMSEVPASLLLPHVPASPCHGPTPPIPSASPSPMQLLHPHTSSFVHPHITWSYAPNSFCIPLPHTATSPHLLLSTSPHPMVLHPHSFCIPISPLPCSCIPIPPPSHPLLPRRHPHHTDPSPLFPLPQEPSRGSPTSSASGGRAGGGSTRSCPAAPSLHTQPLGSQYPP